MDRIRVLIADDHSIVRMGLSSLLETSGKIEVVGEAVDGADAVRKAVRLKPDVIVMDLVMPRKNGVAATEEIRALLPGTRILLLTTFGTSDDISRALKAGAHGAILKSASNRDLLSTVPCDCQGPRSHLAGGRAAARQRSAPARAFPAPAGDPRLHLPRSHKQRHRLRTENQP